MTQPVFKRLLRLTAIVLDALIIWASLTVALHLRGGMGDLDDPATLMRIFVHYRSIAVASWILTLALFRCYSTREFGSGTETYRRVLTGSITSAGVLATALFLTQTPLSRAFFILAFVVGVPALLLGRLLLRRALHRFYTGRHGGQRVLLVGPDDAIAQMTQILSSAAWLGLRPVATARPLGTGVTDSDTPTFDGADGLLKLVDHERIDLVLFAAGSVPSSIDFRRYVWEFEGHHTQLAVVLSLVDVAADRIRTRPVAGLPIVYVEDPRSDRALAPGKRIFDFLGALVILVLVSPIMLATAIAVKSDGGPIFFSQDRVGRDGKHFQMLKFRSMVVDAEARLAELTGGNETNMIMFKLEKDPRITKVGGFIRRFSIDELPQLINVLRGDMSLVGPRPPLPREVAQYTEDEWRRMRVRPGLTGLWQVSGRSDLSWDETIRLDLYYIDNWSPLQDLSILMRTFQAVVSPRGAY